MNEMTEARSDFSITECTKSNAIETVTQKWNMRPLGTIGIYKDGIIET